MYSTHTLIRIWWAEQSRFQSFLASQVDLSKKQLDTPKRYYTTITGHNPASMFAANPEIIIYDLSDRVPAKAGRLFDEVKYPLYDEHILLDMRTRP